MYTRTHNTAETIQASSSSRTGLCVNVIGKIPHQQWLYNVRSFLNKQNYIFRAENGGGDLKCINEDIYPGCKMIKKSKDVVGYCKESSWAWLLQLLGRLRQEDCEFEASLLCISRPHFRWGKSRKDKAQKRKGDKGSRGCHLGSVILTALSSELAVVRKTP